jgi:hypothetical protein
MSALTAVAAHPVSADKPVCRVSDIAVDKSDPGTPGPAPDADAKNSTQPKVSTAKSSRTITERQTIFGEVERVLRSASQQASRTFPDRLGSVGLPTAPSTASKKEKSSEKRAAMAIALEQTNLAPVLQRYKLSCNEVRAITLEGRQTGWPTP